MSDPPNLAPLEPGPPDSLPVEAWASDAEAKALQDQGSAFVGFLLGLVCGVAALVLFASGAKPRTRTGIVWGFIVQVALLGVAIGLFHDRLMLR